MSEALEARERTSIDRDLASVDEEMRRLAVERLLELPSGESIPRLIECLGDASWRVRKAAVERLVACNEFETVVDSLIVALSDGENPGRRNSAVEALVACGPRVVPRLLDGLGSHDVDVRKLLVDSIAGIGDESARASMIDTLADSDANVRAAAADALGALAGEDAAEALVRSAANDGEDQLVRFSALRALARLEVPIPVAALGTVLDDPVLRAAGFALLGYADDDESVACLLKGLSSNSRPTREAGMEALLRVLGRADGAAETALVEQLREAASQSDALVPSAIERLTEADLASRLVFIQFLGLLEDERAVVPILEAGRDEAISEVAQATLEALGTLAEEAIDAEWPTLDTDARRDACHLLGRTRGERGTRRLRAALDDTDSELRAAAATSLGERGCVESLDALLRCLDAASQEDDFESEEEVAAVECALVAIAQRVGIGPGESVPVIDLLSPRLEGAAESLRLSVATVISLICREDDEELIALLQKDTSEHVRRVAVEGLTRLTPGSAVGRLRLALADEAPTVRMAAAVALGRSMETGVTDDLTRLLADEDARVCAAAVRAIGNRASAGDSDRREECVEVISRVLDGEAMVAMAGVEALSAIGGPRAAVAAACVLDRAEPELVQDAISCIGAHGDAASLEELLPLVSHESWAVRADVIQVLAERRVAHAVPPILRRLETEQDGFVRDAILRALRRLEG